MTNKYRVCRNCGEASYGFLCKSCYNELNKGTSGKVGRWRRALKKRLPARVEEVINEVLD